MKFLTFSILAYSLLATACASAEQAPVKQKFFGSENPRREEMREGQPESQVTQAPPVAAARDPEAPKHMEPVERSQVVAAQPVAPAAFTKGQVQSENLAKEDAPIVPSEDAVAPAKQPDSVAQKYAPAAAQPMQTARDDSKEESEDTKNVMASAPANDVGDLTEQDKVTVSQAAAPMKESSDHSAMKDLFDRWEKVWHEGKYDLIPGAVAKNYTRHDEYGNKTVTAEEYAKEIPVARTTRPGIHFDMYDHSFSGDRAWFRFVLRWKDKKSNQDKMQAGIQEYRVEDGKLAETWLVLLKEGTTWPDKAAQAHWTSEAVR